MQLCQMRGAVFSTIEITFRFRYRHLDLCYARRPGCYPAPVQRSASHFLVVDSCTVEKAAALQTKSRGTRGIGHKDLTRIVLARLGAQIELRSPTRFESCRENEKCITFYLRRAVRI